MDFLYQLINGGKDNVFFVIDRNNNKELFQKPHSFMAKTAKTNPSVLKNFTSPNPYTPANGR